MPITEFAELANTRVGTEDQREIRWRVIGTDVDDRDVFNFAIVKIATLGLDQYDGMPQSEPLQIEHVRDYDPEYWIVTARYQRQGSTRREQEDQDAEFKLSWDFDFSSELKTIIFSRETIQKVGRKIVFQQPGPNTPPFKNLVFENAGGINLDEEDRPQGADIYTPAFRAQLTFTPPQGFVTGAYVNKVADLAQGSTGEAVVNKNTFPIVGARDPSTLKGLDKNVVAARIAAISNNPNSVVFEPGEVLFAGARFPFEFNKITAITYEFLISRNRTNVEIKTGFPDTTEKPGEESTQAALLLDKVDGWDLVHIRYTKVDNPRADEVDVDGNQRAATILAPHTAYVERTYERKDLNRLFLPGSE